MERKRSVKLLIIIFLALVMPDFCCAQIVVDSLSEDLQAKACHNKPRNLRITNMSLNSVSFEWMAQSSYGPFLLAIDNDTMRVTNNTYTRYGLSSGRLYQLSLSSELDSLLPQCSLNSQFRLPCNVLRRNDLNYTYGFEDASASGPTGVIDSCLRKYDNGQSCIFYPTTDSPRDGNYCLLANVSSLSDTCILALPYYFDNVNETMVNLWLAKRGTQNFAQVSVGVMTNPYDPATFTHVAWAASSSSDYVMKEITLDSYLGLGHYVAFLITNQTGPVAIDDIVLQPITDCPAVTQLQTLAASNNQLLLYWNDSPSANTTPTSYEIFCTPAAGGATQVSYTTSHTILLSGLQPETRYCIQVRALCQGHGALSWETIYANTMGVCNTTQLGSENYIHHYQSARILSQTIFTSSELSEMGLQAGNITHINYKWSANALGSHRLKLYLGSTTNCTAWGTPITSGQTLVCNEIVAAQNYVHTATYQLTTPYYWDGFSNLVLTSLIFPDSEVLSFPSFDGYFAFTNQSRTYLAQSNDAVLDINSMTQYPISYSGSCPIVSFTACFDSTHCLPPFAVVDDVFPTEVRIHWHPRGNESRWTVQFKLAYDSIWHNVATNLTDTFYIFSNLDPVTKYHFRVIAECSSRTASNMIAVRTLCSNDVRFDYANLYSPNVTCSAGLTTNMIVDFGPQDTLSRHTVHTDPDERDPRTGNQLLTVCPGYCSSVRLGNCDTHAQTESITYRVQVDTNNYGLLLLKYAAVLEDPGHSQELQPRFEFSVLDEWGHVINTCYNAQFFANASDPGWLPASNSSLNTIIYKDWTTVGIDLAPLHGQTIYIKLTTYDCGVGAHFGYAYFVLDYADRNLRSTNCNSVENIFRAPAGFNYQWYAASSPNTILSTADTLEVTSSGLYYCKMSFAGAPNDAEHADCYCTLSAYAGANYPYPRFSHVVDSVTCTKAWIHFINSSIATSDMAHQDSVLPYCQSYLWKFDDGTTSTERSPVKEQTLGRHYTTLYAMLADGQCIDSVTRSYFIHSPCPLRDTTYRYLCHGDTLMFYDLVISDPGTYRVDTTYRDSVSWVRILIVGNKFITDTVNVDTCDYYRWNVTDMQYTQSGCYGDTTYNPLSCDSILVLNLALHLSYDLIIYDTLYYGDTLYVGDTIATTDGTYYYFGASSHGCDSAATIHLTYRNAVRHFTYDTICQFDSVFFRGRYYGTTGMYTDTLRAADQIHPDTVYYLMLTVIPRPQVSLDYTLHCDTSAYYLISVQTDAPVHNWYSIPADPALLAQNGQDTLVVSPQSPTTYVVTAVFPGYDCVASDTLHLQPSIKINADIMLSPKAITSSDRELNVSYLANSQVNQSEWYIGYNRQDPYLISTDESFMVEVPSYVDSMTIMLMVQGDFCADTDTVRVPIIHSSLFFPNIFTPNASSNNVFMPLGTGFSHYQLWIFDRRGDLVFSTSDPRKGWDGSHNGRPCSQGTYTYRCRYIDVLIPDGYQNVVGTVTLIR